ncbi:MAG: Lrp/AsnC family transcriptional regulator, partial [Chitinophagaceae bacterium]|nr:Lrp/AsnC family transcriptional regulator [Chitinophagaceae bacterium]
VKLSTTPVHEHIRRLETQGVIRQYATLLNPNLVNKGLMVICYVSLRQHNKSAGSKFIKSIMEMPEIIACYNISGEFDFMLKVVAENMDDYYHFHVNKLSQAENIGQLQSVFVMGVIKDTHVLV